MRLIGLPRAGRFPPILLNDYKRQIDSGALGPGRLLDS